MKQRTAIIIGAGPAGLTAAFEILRRTTIKPIIYEMSDQVGGISKTVNYKGNRIDIGGHRFFSKSDAVMQWWRNILPLQAVLNKDAIQPDGSSLHDVAAHAPDPAKEDRVMLLRKRLSRIFYLGKLFDYPVALNLSTLMNLGLRRTFKIAVSYARSHLFPIPKEESLEDFLINRFGRELYSTFFRDYTEKVWGVPCREIGPEWGAQRIKNLSVSKAVLHAAKANFSRDGSLAQKRVETSLIGQFLYPKFGPGQMWEEVARIVQEQGGELHLRHRVVGLHPEARRISSVVVHDQVNNENTTVSGDYFFSSMAVQDLIESWREPATAEVQAVAKGLRYRDFITVGLLVKRLSLENGRGTTTNNNIIPDNWIYVQEESVRLGRLQIFNNWSPYMVRDPHTVWLGLEYFCNEGDELWIKSDQEFIEFAIHELDSIGIVAREDVLDSTLIRMPKAYPAYFGSYNQFDVVRRFTDGFENLFLIGRNGMHRYNNQDHSMLTAMAAVDAVATNQLSKEHIWNVNEEEDYHEEK
jgi:protoporphyrinogen oxidase